MHLEHFRLLLQAALAAPAPAPTSPTSPLLIVATFISQIKINGFTSWLIERMKDAKTPALAWISTNTPWVTRAVALLAAGLTAAGLKWTYTGSIFTATGLSIVISGVSIPAAITAVYNVAQNFLMQHAWYKMVFAAPAAPAAAVPAAAQPAAKA